MSMDGDHPNLKSWFVRSFVRFFCMSMVFLWYKTDKTTSRGISMIKLLLFKQPPPPLWAPGSSLNDNWLWICAAARRNRENSESGMERLKMKKPQKEIGGKFGFWRIYMFFFKTKLSNFLLSWSSKRYFFTSTRALKTNSRPLTINGWFRCIFLLKVRPFLWDEFVHFQGWYPPWN